ncbi:hypothetical protein CDAR_387341 [Caerostris darwini]|uniref:Uncharacterized protein n=1 Tax=Caerostris darwini TaxID=1538125 RepID=A0AAV4MX85_9ARAC|nr:hypothetical protein CDAR_387341 [Caerostris darwini]
MSAAVNNSVLVQQYRKFLLKRAEITKGVASHHTYIGKVTTQQHGRSSKTQANCKRFAAKFPFRESSCELGSSRGRVMHRLHQIELRCHMASSLRCFLQSNSLSLESTLTKRTLLSKIAKTFDSFGWLSSIRIQCKLIMQKLWKYQLQ